MNRRHRTRIARPLVAIAAVTAVGGGMMTMAHADDAAAGRALQIRPGELDRGPRAGVAHIIGRTIYAGGDRIRTDLAHRPTLEGRSRQGFVVKTIAPRTGATRLWNIHRDGSKTFIARLPRSWQAVEVSTDGSRVAYSWAPRGDVKLAVRLTRSGRRIDTATFPNRFTELVGFGKRRALLTRWRPAATFWYSPATGQRQRIANKQTWRADVRRDRIALAVRVDDGGYDGVCLRYAKVSAPRQQLWYSCKQKPVAWAARGGKVLTTNIATDGLGASALQVRRAGGKLLRTYRADLFGSARFSGKNTVLFSAQGPRKAALVRCVVGGDCERTTRLRPAHQWGPDAALKLSLLR